MSLFVCLLRGINVGGHRKMAMSELRNLAASHGCTDVQSYLQSGNLVFRASASKQTIRTTIAQSLRNEFGSEVDVFAYTKSAFDAIAGSNPFSARSECDPKFQHVTFVDGGAGANWDRTLISGNNGDEAILSGANYYVYCPNGYGRTKLTNGYFEKLVGRRATTRNWRTVTALAAMLET